MNEGFMNKKILLIDDELPVVEALQKFLEHQGFQVTIQNHSTAALSELKKHPDTYNLVITDLTMPEMDGLLLSKNIHSLIPDLPILLMTGYGNQLSEEKLILSGISKVISKPFRLSEIITTIQELL